MNKADLIAEVAAKSGASSAETERVLNGFRDVVASSVSMGDDVSYPGLGKFSRVERGERMARNPRTGESVVVPPSSAPKFTASSKLKAIVAGKEPAPA
ncbi:MAG: HU family DNA-binding protein [Chloroflexi bacterium]|nr:HU family DNA-binding protein [Chloroflexota bacterium]